LGAAEVRSKFSCPFSSVLIGPFEKAIVLAMAWSRFGMQHQLV
jgi:hypothetical protein